VTVLLVGRAPRGVTEAPVRSARTLR
jgi:hypothetical protein